MGAERPAKTGVRQGTGPERQADEARRPVAPARPAQVMRSQLEAARLLAADVAGDAPSAPVGTLLVGPAEDPHEYEAEAMARQVVASIRASRASGQPATTSTARRSLASSGPVTRRRAVVGAEGGPLDGDTDARIRRARGGGAALDAGLRGDMEGAFGADFSRVRIHTGGEAATLNERLQAEAFTVGNDVFLGRSYHPGSGADQELVAHELTHVVQQGGAGPLQRKMWKADQFTKATEQKGKIFKAGASEAQKVILALIKEYSTTVEGHGVVMKGDEAKAINLLLNMHRATEIWIEDHQVDEVVEGPVGPTGEGPEAVKTSDPKRLARMKGMLDFQLFLTSEVESLQEAQQSSGADVTTDIAEKSPGLVKYEERKSTAKSVLENMGIIIDKVAPNDGDSTTLEVGCEFPVEPSGVAFVGIDFTVEVSKDDGYVKARVAVDVTAGGSLDLAKLKGSIGGYIEAQGATGKDVMALISYGLYRRFVESSIIPQEASNYLWGGNWGDYGKKKADKWSRLLEERMFSAGPEPVLDVTPGVDAVAAQTAFDTDHAAWLAKKKDIVDNVYVESGGALGLSAELDGGVITGEVSAGFTSGKKIDFESLESSKGGAGKQNAKAKGWLNDVSGGARGAEESVAKSVNSFNLKSSLGGSIPAVGAASGEVGLTVGWTTDASGPGEPVPSAVLDTNDLDVAFSITLPFSLLGPGMGKIVDWLSGKLVGFIRDAIAKMNDPSTPPKKQTAMQEATTAVKDFAAVGGALKEAKEGLIATQGDTSGITSGSTLNFALNLDGASTPFKGSLDITRQDEKALKLPKILEVKLTRAKRIVKIEFAGGAAPTVK